MVLSKVFVFFISSNDSEYLQEYQISCVKRSIEEEIDREKKKREEEKRVQ